jgi:protein-disulfide isomerase
MRNMLIILGGIAILAIGGVALYQWQGRPAAPPPAPAAQASGATPEEIARARAISANDFTIGKVDAPITIIEYASLTCPHCADFHVNVLPKLKAAYVDSGKIRIAFRDFPLDRPGLAAAMVARCAGPERHNGLNDLFFARQREWSTATDPISAMAKLAALAGMSSAEVQACLNKEDIQNATTGQRLLAEKVFDISATPSFIIQGKKHSGGMTFEQFKAILDPLIAKATK